MIAECPPNVRRILMRHLLPHVAAIDDGVLAVEVVSLDRSPSEAAACGWWLAYWTERFRRGNLRARVLKHARSPAEWIAALLVRLVAVSPDTLRDELVAAAIDKLDELLAQPHPLEQCVALARTLAPDRARSLVARADHAIGRIADPVDASRALAAVMCAAAGGSRVSSTANMTAKIGAHGFSNS